MATIPNALLKTVYKIDKINGYYDYNNGGEWVEGTETKTAFKGAVLPLSNDDVRYDEGGTYSSNDRKLYTTKELSLNQQIEFNSIKYTVDKQRNYDYVDSMRIYFVKREGETVD